MSMGRLALNIIMFIYLSDAFACILQATGETSSSDSVCSLPPISPQYPGKPVNITFSLVDIKYSWCMFCGTPSRSLTMASYQPTYSPDVSKHIFNFNTVANSRPYSFTLTLVSTKWGQLCGAIKTLTTTSSPPSEKWSCHQFCLNGTDYSGKISVIYHHHTLNKPKFLAQTERKLDIKILHSFVNRPLTCYFTLWAFVDEWRTDKTALSKTCNLGRECVALVSFDSNFSRYFIKRDCARGFLNFACDDRKTSLAQCKPLSQTEACWVCCRTNNCTGLSSFLSNNANMPPTITWTNFGSLLLIITLIFH